MHKLPDLSYDYGALEPHIDAQTMEIHILRLVSRFGIVHPDPVDVILPTGVTETDLVST